jgi:hypothetical protein
LIRRSSACLLGGTIRMAAVFLRQQLILVNIYKFLIAALSLLTNNLVEFFNREWTKYFLNHFAQLNNFKNYIKIILFK